MLHKTPPLQFVVLTAQFFTQHQIVLAATPSLQPLCGSETPSVVEEQSKPTQLVITDQFGCSSKRAPECEEIPIGEATLFRSQHCTEDIAAFTNLVFGSAPYLVVEKYVNDTNCGTAESAVVYNADGECSNSIIDGTSFKILPKAGGSVTITTYPTTSCIDTVAEYVTVGAKYVNTDRCYEDKFRLYANMTAFLSPSSIEPPSTGIDYQARQEIMFPEWLWEPTPRRVLVTT
ncbi:hypothetical protein PHYPSEUDO_002754 [Phytophthora pseudosyringae]|uniref:Uncharacterized protein n=1 Tax=Phytophthora pseudosyringae TaxID=221518 RepID=A0A8T1VSX7_9STRA|nr:hypothetical protein PHYPSEUDO_002754 [Phytophthora pseudosyringae]